VRGAGAGSISVIDGEPLPAAYYDRDPRVVARALLGALLECRSADGVAAGRIVETEAYLGADDPACHAVVGRTRRTWHLHGPPGVAYVYFIYGVHWCVNAVTEPEGVGSAVLIRAIEPVAGLALMRRRRPRARRDEELANGPGKLCAALGIDGALDGHPLDRPPLRILAGPAVPDAAVGISARVGITRATDLPLRWYLRGSAYLSRGRPASEARPAARPAAAGRKRKPRG
jgi:DNA-3-methyladenine glycosylase